MNEKLIEELWPIEHYFTPSMVRNIQSQPEFPDFNSLLEFGNRYGLETFHFKVWDDSSNILRMNYLDIHFKEEFDTLIKRLKARPVMFDSKTYGAPYGFGHYAHFYYALQGKSLEFFSQAEDSSLLVGIRGNIVRRKIG